MGRAVGCLLFPLAFVVGTAFPASGQVSTGHSEHVSHPFSLSVLVNGAVTPERISDDIAYRHLVLALALPATATPRQLGIRAARLRQMQLTQSDVSLLLSALQGIPEQVSASEASPDDGDIKYARKRAILDEARTRILRSLSVAGVVRLHEYIETHVKKHIIVYGGVQ